MPKVTDKKKKSDIKINQGEVKSKIEEIRIKYEGLKGDISKLYCGGVKNNPSNSLIVDVNNTIKHLDQLRGSLDYLNSILSKRLVDGRTNQNDDFVIKRVNATEENESSGITVVKIQSNPLKFDINKRDHPIITVSKPKANDSVSEYSSSFIEELCNDEEKERKPINDNDEDIIMMDDHKEDNVDIPELMYNKDNAEILPKFNANLNSNIEPQNTYIEENKVEKNKDKKSVDELISLININFTNEL